MKNYRVTFWHAAGWLVSKTVQAHNKVEAESTVRAMYPSSVFSRLSSVKAV